jgi:hypothetical protein
MQSSNSTPVNITQIEQQPYWVFPFGLANNTLIAHQLGQKDSSRFVTYINTNDPNATTTFTFANPN